MVVSVGPAEVNAKGRLANSNLRNPPGEKSNKNRKAPLVSAFNPTLNLTREPGYIYLAIRDSVSNSGRFPTLVWRGWFPVFLCPMSSTIKPTSPTNTHNQQSPSTNHSKNKKNHLPRTQNPHHQIPTKSYKNPLSCIKVKLCASRT